MEGGSWGWVGGGGDGGKTETTVLEQQLKKRIGPVSLLSILCLCTWRRTVLLSTFFLVCSKK